MWNLVLYIIWFHCPTYGTTIHRFTESLKHNSNSAFTTDSHFQNCIKIADGTSLTVTNGVIWLLHL